MKRGARTPVQSAGFTIVETMIVLAVTGVLFVAIVGTWSGRQHHNEFMTSAQDIRSRIQQTIGDVQNGFFPNSAGFSCTAMTGNVQLSGVSSQQQGTNAGCIFMGKVMQFGIGTADTQQYRTFVVAGAKDQKNLTDTDPTVVAPDGTSVSTPPSDLSAKANLTYGLRAVKMVTGDASKTPLVAVGFLSSIEPASSDSGAQQVDLYALPGDLSTSSNGPTGAHTINQAFAGAIINTSVQICFESGATDQYALVTIGGDSGQLSTNLTIIEKGGATSPCNL